MKVVEIPFSRMQLLPPRPEVCQECAVSHGPREAHNAQSLYYQYYFYRIHGRWPTWMDAISHCDYETRNRWVEELVKLNIIPFPLYRNWGNPEAPWMSRQS
jgi:hypothetical protein